MSKLKFSKDDLDALIMQNVEKKQKKPLPIQLLKGKKNERI